MSEPQGPNTGQEASSDSTATPTNGPPACGPTGIPQMPSEALPPPPTLATTNGLSPAAVVGGSAGAAGGSLTIVACFLPWVTLFVVASVGCRGPFEVAMVRLSAWNVALGSAGPPPALATWLLFVMALLVIVYGIRALADPQRALHCARVMLGATAVALVDVGVQSFRWVTTVLPVSSAPGVNRVLAATFRDFGLGLWVMVSGLLAALAGGAVLHGAARSPGRRLPLPETALAVASLLALVGSGALTVGIASPPSLAPETIACHGQAGAAVAPSAQSVYATAGDTVNTLSPYDGGARWQCRNAFVSFQTASPPALADGTLYVAALDGTVLAVRTDDGALLWHRRVLAGNQYPLPFGTFGATGLVAADGAVYGNDGTGGVFALRAADGAVLWHNTLPLQTPQPDTPLVVADGFVYGRTDITCRGGQGLFALDAHTGALLWRAAAPGLRSTAFAVDGGRTYDEEVEPVDAVYRVDFVARAASDGAVLWRLPVGAVSSVPHSCHSDDLPPLSFAIADGIIYLQSNAAVETPGPFHPLIRALRAADGTVLWSFTTDPSAIATYGSGGNGIAVASGMVYAAVRTMDAVEMYALSAGDGLPLWHARLSSNGPPDYRVSEQAPVRIIVVGGTAYAAVAGQGLAAINVRDGSERWEYHPANASGAPASLSVTAAQQVVVSGDLAYLGGNQLTALDTRDGSVRWQLTPPPASAPPQAVVPMYSAPTLGPVAGSGGRLIVPSALAAGAGAGCRGFALHP
jgi:outer membrane protein assembly factor BamB